MKSPITGNPMSLKTESRQLTFRKETFTIKYHFLLCEDSGEHFTTTEIDEFNMLQLFNQYREKHNLPFPEEIISVRDKYGLATGKMAEILGFDVNIYRNYEEGEVPDQANGRLIQIASDPVKFKELVRLAVALDEKQSKKLMKRMDVLMEQQQDECLSLELREYLLGEDIADEYSGYRKPSLEKLTEMVVFFSEKLEPWKAKLNKLLFYADFLSFKKSGFSISGARYRAVPMGPVPHNFHSIYEYIANKEEIEVLVAHFPSGADGEQFKTSAKKKFRAELFSGLDLEILQKIADEFRENSTNNMMEISHLEKGWVENEKERKMISYKDYAFDLSLDI